MTLSAVIAQWLAAEHATTPAAKKAARDHLVTALWATYRPILYALARRLSPGEQSDIVASGFKKFVEQLDRGKITATTREELFALLKRRIRDKVCEQARKEQRRHEILPVFAENELLGEATAPGQDGSGAAEGVAQWAISREAPPEFRAIIDDLLEAAPAGRLRDVLVLKIEDPERSNADIACILGVSDREVGRRLARVREQLAQKCE